MTGVTLFSGQKPLLENKQLELYLIKKLSLSLFIPLTFSRLTSTKYLCCLWDLIISSLLFMIEVEREKQAVRVGEVIIDESLLSMEERENGSFLKSPQSNIICNSYSLLVFSQIIKKNLLCVSDHTLMLLQ